MVSLCHVVAEAYDLGSERLFEHHVRMHGNNAKRRDCAQAVDLSHFSTSLPGTVSKPPLCRRVHTQQRKHLALHIERRPPSTRSNNYGAASLNMRIPHCTCAYKILKKSDTSFVSRCSMTTFTPLFPHAHTTLPLFVSPQLQLG